MEKRGSLTWRMATLQLPWIPRVRAHPTYTLPLAPGASPYSFVGQELGALMFCRPAYPWAISWHCTGSSPELNSSILPVPAHQLFGCRKSKVGKGENTTAHTWEMWVCCDRKASFPAIHIRSVGTLVESGGGKSSEPPNPLQEPPSRRQLFTS